ncbi:hypothetical protein H9P43_007152 [Blastocladiella emersonii ATCC 22665]|nr:hypothetical protein H9P43_007152 [Blastocladiella emersonii ATCC 22665]
MTNTELKQTCCGCVPIRRGILALLTIELIISVAAAFLVAYGVLTVKTSTKNADGALVDASGNVVVSKEDADTLALLGYISGGIFGLQALWTLFGLMTVVKRKVTGFKFFAYITGLFAILTIVGAALTPSLGNIVGAVLNCYFTYVFVQYSKVLREEHNASSGYVPAQA